MSDNAPEIAPPRKADPTIEELRQHATAAGADLVLTAAGRPMWWYEPDGSLHVAVEYPAPPPADPDPSGDACSRCGRPWSPSTGAGMVLPVRRWRPLGRRRPRAAHEVVIDRRPARPGTDAYRRWRSRRRGRHHPR